MSDGLAARHKSSLTLKSPINQSLLVKKTYSGDSRDEMVNERNVCKPKFLPPLLCLYFFIHWLLVCLVWSILYRTDFSADWPYFWPYAFWSLALAIWLAIMLILLAICRYERRFGSKEIGTEIRPISSPYYRTDLEAVQPEVKRSRRSSARRKSAENCGDESHEKGAKRKDRIKLPPLAIHRDMSGESNEHFGDVVDVRNDWEKSSRNSDSDSIKRFLKIVTVQTPLTPESDKSTKSPLSPRDLFFIDLIREAEKFDINETKLKHLIADEKSPDENRANVAESFFIASVESPKRERSEAFVEVTAPCGDEARENGARKWDFDKNGQKTQFNLPSDARECDGKEKAGEEEEKL